MKKVTSLSLVFLLLIFGFLSCDNDSPDSHVLEDENHDLLLVTNITSSNPVTAYVGTVKDLEAGEFRVSNARQAAQYPFVTTYGDDVFVLPNRGGDIVKKYHRNNGLLDEVGSLTLPASSQSICMVFESSEKAYISLWVLGKIAVINPTTMTILEYIDLTSYAIGDASPDPTNMVLRNGKLYVACVQTSDQYTSAHPAQILIIDLNNENAITSLTDSRSAWAGSVDDMHSMFFDEQGDLYVFCVASYGFAPGQKCGFLRVKNGETTFDPDYFFNVADYSIDGIPNNKVDYLQHMIYHENGTVFSTGNIYALASNPPDYVNDRTMGSFMVDLYNQTITKLDLPYCNGYSASVTLYQNNVLWGLATASGVGIYTYNLSTEETSTSPVVTTQGDPSVIEVFN